MNYDALPLATVYFLPTSWGVGTTGKLVGAKQDVIYYG